MNKRPKAAPGPVPSLGDLAAQASWVWVYCEARDCHHRAPLKLADVFVLYGKDMSSDILRAKTRCSKCGGLGGKPSPAELG
jgi:hypothetical protein